MLTVTKAKKVETYFRSRISQGIWKPGSKIPEAEMISSDLGVSFSTVKNVMARLANDGLLERSQRLGTFVSSTVKTASIAFVAQAYQVQTSISTHYHRFTERAVQCIETHGYQPIFKVGYGDTVEKFLASMQFPHSLDSKEIVGILTIAGMDSALESLGIPFVSLVTNRLVTNKHSVVLDYDAMHEIGIQALRDRGYDDFAIMHLDQPATDWESWEYKELKKQRLALVGDRADRIISCPCTPDCRHAYATLKRYWEAGNRPRAIFFTDEVVFDVASRAILEMGIKVPEELALLTQGTFGAHYHFPVPIATVEFDAGQNASIAWELLENLIMNQSVQTPIFIKPRLREGQTL